MPKEITYQGKKLTCYTVSELASFCDKAPSSIRDLEHKGRLPRPNLVIMNSEKSSIRGKIRLYTEANVLRIAPIISKWKQYRKTPNEEIAEVQKSFLDELNFLNSLK